MNHFITLVTCKWWIRRKHKSMNRCYFEPTPPTPHFLFLNISQLSSASSSSSHFLSLLYSACSFKSSLTQVDLNHDYRPIQQLIQSTAVNWERKCRDNVIEDTPMASTRMSRHHQCPERWHTITNDKKKFTLSSM